MDCETFYGTAGGGRIVDRAGTKYVMPPIGKDKNIMCDAGGISTYIKARSTGIMPPCRPNGREDISPEARVLPEKWEPVFRKEARQNKELGSVRDSTRTGQTLVFWNKRLIPGEGRQAFVNPEHKQKLA